MNRIKDTDHFTTFIKPQLLLVKTTNNIQVKTFQIKNYTDIRK